MDRAVAMLVIGLVLGGGLGFAIAAGNGITLNGHDHAHPAHHHGTAGHDRDHAALTPLDLPSGPQAPALRIALTPDRDAGWTLQVQADRFRFAPERAGDDPRAGEGHAHLYVNGAKTARLYGEWTHLEALPRGEATVTVALYGNDHRPIHVDGLPVADSVTLTVP